MALPKATRPGISEPRAGRWEGGREGPCGPGGVPGEGVVAEAGGPWSSVQPSCCPHNAPCCPPGLCEPHLVQVSGGGGGGGGGAAHQTPHMTQKARAGFVLFCF